MGTHAEALDAETERRLGVDLFNKTWTLMEKTDRTLEEDDEMIHCAHASAYHWLQVGTPANRARSEWQCSRVHAILGHERGWTADGSTGFRLVGPDEPADFMVRIATPGTVDDICGQYGLDTGGEVNCRVGESVMVNLKRWMTGSPEFSGPVEEYRALIINHEVGHFLGHGHEGCPGPGAPAPAMMQQIKGLDGCVANAWPYDENGEYLSGPAVP